MSKAQGQAQNPNVNVGFLSPKLGQLYKPGCYKKMQQQCQDGEPHDRAGWKSEMMLWQDGRTKECGRFQDVEVDEGVRKRQVRPEK